MDFEWGPVSGVFFTILEAIVTGFAALFGFLQDETGIFNILGSVLVVITGVLAVPLNFIGYLFEWIGL